MLKKKNGVRDFFNPVQKNFTKFYNVCHYSYKWILSIINDVLG